MGRTGIHGMGTTASKRQRPGGRPSQAASAALADTIVGAATELFLRDGFVATSMEAVAAAAGVSKRTLYSRFADKPVLFRAALTKLIARWLPSFDAAIEQTAPLDETLLLAARHMLAAALAPEALALYRLLIAESERIPDLPALLQEAGAGTAIARIAERLQREGVADAWWAAAQFQRLVLTGPQHYAMGLGPPLNAEALEGWAARCVALFRHGVRTGE
jgi:TetR/AcrR family transcriptional repressor of mexJK operon